MGFRSPARDLGYLKALCLQVTPIAELLPPGKEGSQKLTPLYSTVFWPRLNRCLTCTWKPSGYGMLWILATPRSRNCWASR